MRIGAGDDAQRAAVGQVPDALDRLDRLIGGERLRLPAAEIGLLGQLSRRPQAVEDFAVGRLRIEEGGIERPDLAVGGVVEGQLLGAVEDRHRRRQLVEHARVGAEVALHLGRARFRARRDRWRGRPRRRRWRPRWLRTACDRRRRPPGRARARRRRRRAPRAASAHKRLVEQLEPARDRVGAVARFDGARIGEVGPGDMAVDVARPGGVGDRVEQSAQRVERRLRLGVAVAQPGELQPLAGDVADAHHRATGDGAAVDVEMAALEAGGGERERFAAIEQPLDRLLQRRGETGLEPRREGEDAARRRRVGDQREIAFDPRLAVGRVPGEQDLRLAGEKQVGAIEPGAGAGEFAGEFGLALGPAPPAEQVKRRRQHREEQQQQDDEAADVGDDRLIDRKRRPAARASTQPSATTNAATIARAQARAPPTGFRAPCDRGMGCKPRPPETGSTARRRRRLRRPPLKAAQEKRISVFKTYAKPPRKSLTECWRISSRVRV